MRRLIKKHKNKIVYTTPFLFFLFFGVNLLVVPEFIPRESLSFVPVDPKYIPAVGDVFFVDVMATSDMPINAAEITVSFPTDKMEASDVSQDGSILDLWVQEPGYSNTAGTVDWSGGTVKSGGFTGTGKLVNIAFTAKKPGVGTLAFDTGLFAAHDGKGTTLFPVKNSLLYTIRPKTKPSPDLNSDGLVNFMDISTWIAAYFRSYNPEYDLNADGKISTSDLSIFLSRQ